MEVGDVFPAAVVAMVVVVAGYTIFVSVFAAGIAVV